MVPQSLLAAGENGLVWWCALVGRLPRARGRRLPFV